MAGPDRRPDRSPDTRQLLSDGLADALGFLGGGLAGWQAGRLLGVDITTDSGFGAHTLLGWGLLLAGLGAGKWLSLRWRAQRRVDTNTLP